MSGPEPFTTHRRVAPRGRRGAADMPRRCTRTLLGLTLLTLVGCAQRLPLATPELRLFLSARAAVTFRHAAYYKPTASSSAGLEADFAPLIVREVNPSALYPLSSMRDASQAARQPVAPDRVALTLYSGVDSAQAGSTLHDQVVYGWRLPRVGTTDAECVMGLRITLERDGFPVVWEPLRVGGAVRMLFVSASLERRAAEVYGKPLPGRRFSIERSLRDAPDTIVVGVVEDGPIPLGAYVYLPASSCEVSTVLCRCSPSQVEAFAVEATYELAPLEHADAAVRSLLENSQRVSRGLRWPLCAP